MKLSIKYSKEFEIARIRSTVNRIDWYLDNGYKLDLLAFPKNINREKLANISDKEIIEAIQDEYDENRFLASAQSIEQMYTGYQTRLETFIQSLGLPTISSIIVNLTNYGIGGSYNLSTNEIIINISKFYSIGLIRVVLHEIIHLHIEKLINKYKVGHWEKEAIVDLLFEKAFPDIAKKQNIQIKTKRIEEIFERNFPDVEKIISLVSTIPTAAG